MLRVHAKRCSAGVKENKSAAPTGIARRGRWREFMLRVHAKKCSAGVKENKSAAPTGIARRERRRKFVPIVYAKKMTDEKSVIFSF